MRIRQVTQRVQIVGSYHSHAKKVWQINEVQVCAKEARLESFMCVGEKRCVSSVYRGNCEDTG